MQLLLLLLSFFKIISSLELILFYHTNYLLYDYNAYCQINKTSQNIYVPVFVNMFNNNNNM